MVGVERKKLVIVGDGACGKTCLLFVYVKGVFPETYVPTVFENYTADVKFDNQVVEIALWDTAGQEGYDRLRPLAYPDTNVVLIAFSIDSPDSYDNVSAKWNSEVVHFCPQAPIILVGNKKDLRNDPSTINSLKALGQSPVTYEQGVQLAKKIGAAKYLETSAKTRDGVNQLFEEAGRLTVNERRNSKKKCSIL
ncbi:hypothetical protein K502DRAFT_323319 [Neoconidiobolus thromboides FSU 785]|nr:hypothetical protein K502DRAFT_323319 [Neoconidiobolus thromboides FSU 785]